MKDAYSFNASLESLNETYEQMYAAYCRIFARCGLNYLAVEAESGPIGGDASHEFMIPAENGEDTRAALPGVRLRGQPGEGRDRLARLHAAQRAAGSACSRWPRPAPARSNRSAQFLKCRPQDLIKTLIYVADGQPIAVLVRGDHEANEGKIRRARKAAKLELAPPEVIQEVTGAPVGFAGPVGMKEKIPILADRDVQHMANAVTGANAADAHLTGVNLHRDFEVDLFADLRNAVDGDPCPRCSSTLALRHAIEVGHVFKLGTKYTEALNAKFLDADEQLKPIIMGCYGIGVNRIIAGLIETSNDKDGIIWPMALAPYEVVLAPVKVPDEPSMKVARQLHDQLAAAGIDVLLDDRDCRAGVKFKDADLIGVPLRVVIGERGLKEGKLEVKWRWDKEAEKIDLDGAAETLAELIRDGTPRGDAVWKPIGGVSVSENATCYTCR